MGFVRKIPLFQTGPAQLSDAGSCVFRVFMEEAIRINKYLSASGVCSRREADRYLSAGRITVDGKVASPGDRITGCEKICLDGQEIKANPDDVKQVILAFYKEVGTVTSTVDQGKEHNNIVDAVGYPERVYPIGRLDKDSEGLILLTNDGSMVNGLLRARYGHEKEYEVTVDRPIPDDVLEKIRKGGLQLLEDRKSRPCKITRTGKNTYNCILTEGMNREIRRMTEYFGYTVTKLKRIRFMTITLEGLEPGKYRVLSDAEVQALRDAAGIQQ